MKAFLKNYRQSPRKVRLVADLIRGKKVDEAEATLDFTAKRATSHLKKLLISAAANAKENFGIEKDDLYVKDIQVNKGVTLKRWRPRARGAAFPINKRSCHITLVLAEQELKNRKTKEQKNPRPTADTVSGLGKETETKKTASAVKKVAKPTKKTTASTKTKTVEKKEVKAVKKAAPKAKK